MVAQRSQPVSQGVVKLGWSSGIPEGPALLIKEESSACFKERTKPAKSSFGEGLNGELVNEHLGP